MCRENTQPYAANSTENIKSTTWYMTDFNLIIRAYSSTVANNNFVVNMSVALVNISNRPHDLVVTGGSP